MHHLYHLSHTDMDGYGCQFLTQHCFAPVTYANSNYGDEITERLKSFFEQMLLDSATSITLLITDLNLSLRQCEWIESQIEKIHRLKPNTTLELLLLDHHASGSECAQAYPWYRLDTTQSATKITYHWLYETIGCKKIEPYQPLVEAINAADIWLSDHAAFEFGKVLMGAIAASKELNRVLFDQEDRRHKFHLLQAAHMMQTRPDAHIAFDNALHSIKKEFFQQEKDNTLDNLIADFLTQALNRKKEQLLIAYQDKKGVLTYALPNISVVGNAFLKANPDIDFILNISPNGAISLRSDNRVDVSKIAATLADGGGHPNASGGRIGNFKENYRYDNVRRFIQCLIKEKTQGVMS